MIRILLIILICVYLVVLINYIRHRKKFDKDNESVKPESYINEDGLHTYYDRKIIEHNKTTKK